MRTWLLFLLVLLLAGLAFAEDFEDGFLYSWQIPGRNMSGTPLPKDASIRLADKTRGEPVFAGRYALRVESASEVTVMPCGRTALANSPSGYWVVDGRLRVERGQVFTNSYHFNADGGYVGEKQFFFKAAPNWQHLRVVIGPAGSPADVPLSKGGESFTWPLHVQRGLAYFDDFTIAPLEMSRVETLNPGWQRADGTSAFQIRVKLATPTVQPTPGIAGYGSNWDAAADPPPTPATPRAGEKVVLRPGRQGLERIEPAVATTDANGEATFTVRGAHSGTVKLYAYTPTPAGKPYGDCLCATPAVITWAEPSTTVTMEDFTNHHWQNELVQYRLAWAKNENVDPDTVRVKDAAGTVLASQLDDAQRYPDGSLASALVCFIADLPPMGKSRYTVTALTINHDRSIMPAPMPKTDLALTRKNAYEIATDRIALRLPAAPIAAPTKDNIPGPILAMRGRSGAWIGRGWLDYPDGVQSMTPSLRASGPVFADYRVEYAMSDGRYVADIRVIAGSEVALVTEEYDTGKGAFKFSLYDGLQPDTGRWRGHSGRPEYSPGYEGMGSGKDAVMPLKYDREGQIFALAGWMTWWPDTGFYWGVYNSKNPQSDFVGLFRRRSGQWRNPTWPGIEMSKQPGLTASFGLGAGKRLWGLYNSTAADAIPAPVAAPAAQKLDTPAKILAANAQAINARDTSRAGLNRAMLQYGEMPLDKYKEWILDWPGADQDVYPRMFIAPRQLDAVRERVKAIPSIKAQLGRQNTKPTTYMITGDERVGHQLYDGTENGDYNWMGQMLRMQTDITEWLEGEGDVGIANHNLHGQIKIRGNALRYDAAASVKSLTPDERRLLRAEMAFESYKAADLDWVPFDTGFALGNPNMPTAVAATIGLCGAALPSHPYAQEWMDRAYRYVRDTINDFTAPGGAWNECPHYQMDASLQQIMQLATALKNTGYADLYREPKFKATMRYAAEIWTPVDARVGYRVMPSIGNGGLESTSLFGWMASGTRDSDADFAAEQQWMWQNGGQLFMYPYDELAIDPNAPAKAPSFTSRNFPGFGTILRSGAPDAKETYLAFRAGYATSHYEPGDQGEIVLYAKGAPLCMDFASQYSPTVGRPYMHNRVSFNHRYSLDNGSIIAWASGSRADYARSRISATTLMQLPETPEEEEQMRRDGRLQPNTMPPTDEVPTIVWDRQVLFVKDPDPLAANYAVLRESFSGNTTLPTDWNLWTLSSDVKWDGNHAVATAQYGGVLLDVFMLDPVKPEWITGEWAHNFLPGMSNSGWQQQNPGKKFEERQKLLRVKQGPGQGYFAVLYPRLTAENAPEVTPLADGKAVKVTHAQGMDLLVLLPAAAQVQVEGVTMQGTAAIVSKRKGSLTLSLLEGTTLSVDGQGGIAQQKSGNVTLTLTAKELTIATDGVARDIELALPAQWLPATLPADSPLTLKERRAGSWVLQAPAGKAQVTVKQL